MLTPEDKVGMLLSRIMPRYRFVLLLALIPSLLVCQGLKAQLDFPELGDFSSNLDSAGGGDVTLKSEFSVATGDRPAMLFLTLEIAKGYHVYAIDQGTLPNGGGGPMATKIAVNDNRVKVIGNWQASTAPDVHVDKSIWVGLELREHADQVTWYAPIELPAGVDPSTLEIKGILEGQACDPQSCIPFEEAFAAKQGPGINLPSKPVPPSPTGTESTINFWQTVGYAILGGFILNFMPCVLPVIGLKVLSFAKQGGQSRFQVFSLNVSYALGMLLVFMLLATLASLVHFGLSDESLGWGELNTYSEYKIGMAALVFAMALSFLGVWELPIPGFASSGKAAELSAREGLFGALMMGMFTTILATPCSGPFLGSVFGTLLSQPVGVIYAVFGSIGLGMALPYLLIGVFPSLVSWLPKPGAWMETFKEFMGFVLLGTVVWLVSAVPAKFFIPTFTLLIAIWFACWWIGRTPLTATAGQRRRAWLGGTSIATAVGVLAFMLMAPSKFELPWQEYSKTALTEARADGKTVLIDFTAQWCLTCKTNLKIAINREEVKQKVEQNGVVTLLADWTDKNAEIKQTLLEHDSQSIPLLVIYPADGSREPIVLRDLLSKQKVLDALNDAGPSQGYPLENEVQTASSSSETSGLNSSASAFQ